MTPRRAWAGTETSMASMRRKRSSDTPPDLATIARCEAAETAGRKPTRTSACPPTRSGVPRYAALLRGINLGSTNRVSMPDLRSALAEAGFDDVATYVQSGNIVLSGSGSTRSEEHTSELQSHSDL